MKLKLGDNSIATDQLEASIEQQQRVIAKLRELGKPTALADKFLARLKDSLEARRERERNV